MYRLVLIAVFTLVAGTYALAQPPAVAPGQIILFDLPNYRGKSVSYTLAPGERERKIWDLGWFKKRVSSIAVGKAVEARLYEKVGFGGLNWGFPRSNPAIPPIMGDNLFSSMVITPKGQSKGHRAPPAPPGPPSPVQLQKKDKKEGFQPIWPKEPEKFDPEKYRR
jgi:hypothetical protein